jgi:hypothetical protein
MAIAGRESQQNDSMHQGEVYNLYTPGDGRGYDKE